MKKNRDVLYDVLNNDFTPETRGLTREQKLAAIQDYFVGKTQSGTVSFAFNFGECYSSRVIKGETYASMIKNAGRVVSENFRNDEGLNMDVNLENFFASQSRWAYFRSKKEMKGSMSSCIVYETDEQGAPIKVLGVLEGQPGGASGDFTIDSVLLPETDYLPAAEAVKERELFNNYIGKEPDNSAYNVIMNKYSILDNQENDKKDLNLPKSYDSENNKDLGKENVIESEETIVVHYLEN